MNQQRIAFFSVLFKPLLAILLAIGLSFVSMPSAAYAEEAEATDQRENSFRYDNGNLKHSIDTDSDEDGMQARDMTLRAGESSYVTFGQGPCSGVNAKKGIDVSSWQGDINWAAVKRAGVDFAIIRCATGKTFDPQFAANVRGCKNNGIGFGIYYYTYAQQPSQGNSDAQRVLSQLRSCGVTPNDLTYPVYYDLEDQVLRDNMDSSQLAELTRNFVTSLKNAGYTRLGVYSNMSWCMNVLTDSYFKSTDLYRWVAQYNSVGLGYRFPDHPFADFIKRGDVWQFSSSGRIDGINGNVDLNYSYYNMIGPAAEGSMYRLYNPNSGEHFYTASAYEGNSLISVGWRYEGIAWVSPKESGTPVYRVYNPNAGDHHYTTSAYEKDSLVRAGWNYEGIGWYSDDAKTNALHRLYNPNAIAGAHHYTVDKNESDSLARIGWKYEGIGWHGK